MVRVITRSRNGVVEHQVGERPALGHRLLAVCGTPGGEEGEAPYPVRVAAQEGQRHLGSGRVFGQHPDRDHDEVLGRCEATTGIVPFMNLLKQVMTCEPYASAKRVFWVVDNGSSHRGQRSIDRLAARFPNAVLVHTPVHASWLNQVVRHEVA
ncbi:hypothetical protein [Streptomyces sp. NBC_01314]|uniref:hypothetical protein n=1 Tax=Streptomyces sp. NBC_01314 TaxID=2903821 RepID=UPI00308D7F63|nr:hypothetical protein OG622_42670 [Streptomyces sp. NBC_01314]